MTVRMAGLWELGWNTPIKEVELWEYPLRDFGVEALYMVPVSGIRGPVLERETMEEVLAEAGGSSVVFVDERAEVALEPFVHPQDALYVFGKASLSPMATWRRPGDLAVRIETVRAAGMLWPHQAAAVVLYDRMLKARRG